MTSSHLAVRHRIDARLRRRRREAAPQPRQPSASARRPVPDAGRVLLGRSERLHRRLSVASASRLRDGHVHARRPHAARGSPRQSRRPSAGAVQWMTAGRGIIHSEMPQQLEGRMRGFQLWINLPGKEKMKPASYRDIAPEEIPVVALPNGGRVKVIAGAVGHDGERTLRPCAGRHDGSRSTSTSSCLPNAEISLPLAADHNAFVYPYEGALQRRSCRGAGAARDAQRRRARARRSLPRRRGRRGRALSAARREADRRADRAVRSVRDEHARGDRAGAPGLSVGTLRFIERASGASEQARSRGPRAQRTVSSVHSIARNFGAHRANSPAVRRGAKWAREGYRQ